MTSGPFVEKLRHLVVATDAWVGRTTAVGIDVDVCPSLAEVLEVRENRMALVRGILDGSPTPGWNWSPRACPRPVTRRKHARSAAACAWS